jgi:hypothetical protein
MAAQLLQKERHTSRVALIAKISKPRYVGLSASCLTFASGDEPVDSR